MSHPNKKSRTVLLDWFLRCLGSSQQAVNIVEVVVLRGRLLCRLLELQVAEQVIDIVSDGSA